LKKVLKQAGVVHNIKSHAVNQLKLLYPYCVYHTKKEMHSRDTTVLIDLLFDLMLCTILQLVLVLFSIYYGPYSS